jgi:hypothetical protein
MHPPHEPDTQTWPPVHWLLDAQPTQSEPPQAMHVL